VNHPPASASHRRVLRILHSKEPIIRFTTKDTKFTKFFILITQAAILFTFYSFALFENFVVNLFFLFSAFFEFYARTGKKCPRTAQIAENYHFDFYIVILLFNF